LSYIDLPNSVAWPSELFIDTIENPDTRWHRCRCGLAHSASTD